MDNKIDLKVEKINYDLFTYDLTEQEMMTGSQCLENSLVDKIVVAQVSSTIGDVKSNALKAIKLINWAQKGGAKLVIFPKNFLLGCFVDGLVKKFPVLADECEEWIKVIAQKTGKTKVLIDFIQIEDTDNDKVFYNTLAVLANGQIEHRIKREVLQGCNCFCDYELNLSECIVDIDDKKIFVVDCQQISTGVMKDNFAQIMQEQKPDLVLDLSIEVSRIKSEAKNSSVMSCIAQKYETPLLFVNQAGATENYVFNGASRLYDLHGNVVLKAKYFEEQLVVCNPFGAKFLNSINKFVGYTEQKSFTLDYGEDLATIYNTLVFAVKNYFEKTGFKRAVLGLSGGLDSTVSAVILADAIGAKNVLGVSMPSVITSEDSKNDAKLLAQNLGIQFFEIPVKEMCDTTKSVFEKTFAQAENVWDCRYKMSFTNDNIQARSRAVILWGIANEFESCLPIATSDKSELYMGYATINGDMSGGYAPLADVTKTKLFALAKWMNENRTQKNAIPESIIEKRPGAELAINPKTGKPLLAEEALMPYDFMDEVIWRVENKGQSISSMLDEEFLYEKNMKNLGMPISTEQKQEWLQKFFKRMSFALFKWQLMPPSPIVDICSINGVEYRQPVLSAKANYCKISYNEKLSLANQINQ